jgi:N-acetylglutamate synthase-like GNAT family acetyltransferase
MTIPSFTIRVANRKDEAAVTNLLRESYGVLMADAYDPALLLRVLPIITRANMRLLNSGTYYLALDRETEAVIGCGGWNLEAPGKNGCASTRPGIGHIRHFAVHPDAAGRGVGRALFHECKRSAVTAHVYELDCLASLNAEGFYAALGFKRFGAVGVPLANGVSLPSIDMRYAFGD